MRRLSFRSPRRLGRRWFLITALVLVVVLLSLPWVLSRLVKTVVLQRLEQRLGCKLQVSEVQVWPTRVVLRRLAVKSRDPAVPDPAIFAQVQVSFSPLQLLIGRLHLTELRAEQAILQILRTEGGDDNVSPILERLQKDRTGAPEGSPGDQGGRVSGPDRVVLLGASLDVRSDLGGLHAESLDVELERGQRGQANLSGVAVELPGGAVARANQVTVQFTPAAKRLFPSGLPTVTIDGGSVAPWKTLALTGIAGTIQPDQAAPERAAIQLSGGYGGVARTLWEAGGWIQPDRGLQKHGPEAEIHLRAARFRLSSLDPILKQAPIVDSAETEVDASLDLQYAQHALDFNGSFHMSGLSVYSPRLANEPVRGLGFDVSARGRIEPRTRRFRLDHSVIKWRGAEAVLEAEAEAQPANLRAPRPPAAPGAPEIDPAEGPGWRERWRQVSVHLQIPPISCQSALQAIPAAVSPYLQGFKLSGMFSTDLRLSVDFAQLLRLPPAPKIDSEDSPEAEVHEAELPAPPPPPAADPPKRRRSKSHHHLPPLRLPTGGQVALPVPAGAPEPGATGKPGAAPKGAPGVLPGPVILSGKVGIDGCKVIASPSEMSAEKLQDTFEHSVEVEPGKVISFVVGQENEDFVPYADISPYLINSIMTTEDNGFMRHRGFIGPEFRSALQQNLERGYFRLGASSITMQMVKNVLLSREKTLSRKLQEMFLTWYLEQNLTKERILEIYFNVIEFGPYIYGIGKATRHYFGKTPKELTPREAAWFSSILPNPKRRYIHFCRGMPDAKWEAYLTRILRRVHERGRLTDEEFNASLEERFTFNREEAQPEKECLALIKRLTTPIPAPDEGAAAGPAP